MKKLLTVIVVGRDDGYGDIGLAATGIPPVKNFVGRLKWTAELNIERLSNNIGCNMLQYIVVDWSPIDGKYIYENNILSDLLKDPIFYNIVVSPSSVINYGLNPLIFYEYVAKNVGVRRSTSEYTLITNPDDIISEELANSMCSAMDRMLDDEYYRPYSRKDVDENFNCRAEGLIFPNNNVFEDFYLGTPASGDFTMAKTSTLVEKGRGYNEEYIQICWSDSELLFNLWKHGVKPYRLDGSIVHLDHAKKSHGGSFHRISYDNISTWGFTLYGGKEINSNTVMI